MGGRVAVAACRLCDHIELLYDSDRKMKTASVIKLPILVHVALAVREGNLDWDEPLTLTAEEKVGGSGVLTQLTPGMRISLKDVCVLMTIVSDNTATNMVIDRIGSEPVNLRMRELGLPITTLFRKAYSPDTPASSEFGLGVTTSGEMLHLLKMVADGTLGDQATCDEIRQILRAQHYRDAIPRLLPDDWRYEGKTGSIDGVRNDVGLVTAPDGRRWALSLFCSDLSDLRWCADNAGLVAMGRIAQSITSSGG